jgi:TorA maturation chaperone TorD
VNDALIHEALARAAVYRVLARAFTYPTAAVVAELGRLAVEVADARGCPGEVRDLLAAFAAAARDADPTAVASEYVFLFDRQVRCPPYEGAWGPIAPMAAGKAVAVADVAGFYAAFGLAPSAVHADMEDHVAAELEFLSVLALKEAYAMAEGHGDGLQITRDAARLFLTDHLGRWAGTFARGLVEASPLPYYATAARLFEGWVEREIAACGATPERLTELAPPGPLEAETFTCPRVQAGAGTEGAPPEA